MKLETAVVITKGFLLTYIPMASGIAAGLPETGLTVLFGLSVKFWVVLLTSTTAGAGGLLAFLSTTFGRFAARAAGGASLGTSAL